MGDSSCYWLDSMVVFGNFDLSILLTTYVLVQNSLNNDESAFHVMMTLCNQRKPSACIMIFAVFRLACKMLDDNYSNSRMRTLAREYLPVTPRTWATLEVELLPLLYNVAGVFRRAAEWDKAIHHQ